jgi:hypothetical protein
LRAYGSSCGVFAHVCVVAFEIARRTEKSTVHKTRFPFFSAVSVLIISHLDQRLASSTYVKIEILPLSHAGFQVLKVSLIFRPILTKIGMSQLIVVKLLGIKFIVKYIR